MPFGNRKFGSSPGPYQPSKFEPVVIRLPRSTVDLSIGAHSLPEGASPNAVNVRLDQSGVSTDFGINIFSTPYGGAGSKVIMNIAPFQLESGTKLLVRMRPLGWDRWNGTNWLTLSGALTGTIADRVKSVVFQNKLVAANGIDKLKAWDGVDGNAIADLSADSPIARFITRVGNRILAAVINPGGAVNPMLVKWSADGNAGDWTTALAGAGGGELEPEGGSEYAGFIRGLSTIKTKGIIYRQAQIVAATLTGVGSQPFRFITVVAGLGTEAPYSIATSYIGDFFLGHDNIIYLYRGEGDPIPVGAAIAESTRNSIPDPNTVTGLIDRKRQEYWLIVPEPKIAWIFNIGLFASEGKVSWRKRDLAGITIKSAAYGGVPTSSDPLINSMVVPIDSVNIRFDDFANNQADTQVLFGDDVGQIWKTDPSLANIGNWDSAQFGPAGSDITVDRVHLFYKAQSAGTAEVSVSTDGGVTWLQPKVAVLAPSGNTPKHTFTWHSVTGPTPQVRIRILTGFVTITEVQIEAEPRGPSRS